MADVEHTEIYTHKSGKKYHVEWTADYDMCSPLEWSDCHGVTERMDWNPTNDEQLEQHIADSEDQEGEGIGLEEETRLRMMRVLARPSNRYDSGLYYDFMATCEKARVEWGVKPEDVVNVVERDFAYLKGWYDDEWHWVCLGVAPLDEYGEPDEDHREYVGGYESTIIFSRNEDHVAQRTEAIDDLIHQIEYALRKESHAGQLELELV